MTTLLMMRSAVWIILFPLLLSGAHAVNVRDHGARGDGTTDDTAAIERALAAASDGELEFPRGRYRLTRTVTVTLSEHGTIGIAGQGGSATVIMAGAGPAFRFLGSHDQGSAAPNSVKSATFLRERMPRVDGLEIVGEHLEADGLEFRNTLQPIIRSVLIRNVRHGLHFTSRNRNVIIQGVHVYNCTGIGLFLDDVNIHQMNIGDSHISYCQGGGIKVVGSEIRNFQITGNDIEYNFAPNGPPVADIWIDLAGKGSVREGTISGNTIQALLSPGGANIRFSGNPANADKVGTWSITGNHIANQEVNIHLAHARGVSVTGNTFLRGYDRHIVLEDSRNVVVSGNVFDHNEDYFSTKPDAIGGISLDRSRGVILSDNIIDGAASGTAKEGGAIRVSDSRDVTIVGSQILNPAVRGVHILRSTNVRMNACLVSEDEGRGRMLAAVELTGPCPGTVVRDNTLALGRHGGIVNRASDVTIELNQ